jgi:hypothetical protein
MSDSSQPEPVDEFLAHEEGSLTVAAIAALAAADRADDQDWPLPDTGTGMPAELQGLSDQELAGVYAAAVVEPDAEQREAEELVWPLSYRTDRPPPEHFGSTGRDWSGAGRGFGEREALDAAPPSVLLAGLADQAYQRRGGLDDDAVVGVMRAYRRLAAQAQARELAMVTELARRRPQAGTPPGLGRQLPAQVSEFLPDEVAPALTLTARAAGTHVGLALELAGRWRIAAALEQGRIDMPKALVLLRAVGPLGPVEAAAIEAVVLPEAGGLTTGQLAAWVARLVLLADPDAARKRRESAQRQAHVACWQDPEGTATLAGRFLPPAEVLAADRRLAAVAQAWKKRGAQGGMDLLRAHAYLALLLGQDTSTPPASLLPDIQDPAGRGHSFPAPSPARTRRPGQDNRQDPADASSDGEDLDPVNPCSPDSRDGPGDHDPPGGSQHPDEQRYPGTSGGLEGQKGKASPPAEGHRPNLTTGRASPTGHQPDSAEHRPPPPGQPPRSTDSRSGPTDGPESTGCRPGSPDHPPGSTGSPLPFTGTVNLTIPLITLLGLADRPGDAAGFGPLHADTARDIACGMSAHPGTRWNLIVTDPSGQAMGYGGPARARRTTTPAGRRPSRHTSKPFDSPTCDAARRSPASTDARGTLYSETSRGSPVLESTNNSPVLFGAGGWTITLTTQPIAPYH